MPRNFTDRDLALYRNRQGENIPVPPAPKRRDNEESRIQSAFVFWWDTIASKQWGIPHFLLFAVGNGGMRSAITGAIMKREGVRRGTSDLILLVPRGKYHALAIEMKTETGKLRPEQTTFIAAARAQGYMAGAAYGFDDAKRFIEAYMRGDRFL